MTKRKHWKGKSLLITYSVSGGYLTVDKVELLVDATELYYFDEDLQIDLQRELQMGYNQEVELDGIKYNVTFTYDPPDESVGLTESWDIQSVFIGEYDVVDVLKDQVLDEIIENILQGEEI